MSDYLAATIPIIGLIAFIIGYFAQKNKWKISKFF
jgi:hypothetical protein